VPASTRLRRLLRRAQPEAAPGPLQEDLGALDPEDRAIVERALPYTMTGVPRLQALVDSVRYCVERGIPGAFVECGVWRGGSVLAMLLTLAELGDTERDVYLYDTFEGMTEPTEQDVSPLEPPALETWTQAQAQERRPWGELFDPDLFNEDAVRATVLSAGYPEERIHFVPGKVEDTIPAVAPDPIALLRLDTDWYESTLHEMEHLYPRLVDSGVLLIDDYGHWEGARRAVDEYFAAHPPRPLLARIDYTGRIAVKH
jgi:O-methyltransferase